MNDFPKRLRKVYDDTHGGKSAGFFDRSPYQTPDEFMRELNNSELTGYFTVIEYGIGFAVVRLLPKGIELCEQITDDSFE